MKYLNIIVACIFTMFATACNCNESEREEIAPHTLLIYMAGDNSLSSYCSTNIRLLKQALIESTDDINLLIYKDNRDAGDGLPVLFQLKRTYEKKTHIAKVDTVYIQKYNKELNSCDPSVMADIINQAFKTFNTEIKGLEIWSHGLSWIPSENFSQFGKPGTRGLKHIGQDENKYTELWDLRNALEKCPHLDYLCFDACFTGMAEIAHELDGVCDYVYGPITEIMGFGFPYNTMLPILASCQKKTDLESTLINCVDDFSKADIYRGYGYTITLLRTKSAANLANALAKLRNASASSLDILEKNGDKYESQFQHYGRSVVGTGPTGSRYYFYEFKDYVNYLAKGESPEIAQLVSEINNNDIVVAYAHSDSFDVGYEKINLKGCKGLGVSIPEFFKLTKEETLIKNAYGMTKWGKTLGY